MKTGFNSEQILSSIRSVDPIHIMKEKEFDRTLLQFGALMSILRNKRINQTMFLSILLENKKIRDCFKQLTNIETDYTLVYNLVNRFPILCKSKIIKNKINNIGKHDRKRKRML